MNILPKSIQDKTTIGLEDTWSARMDLLKSMPAKTIADVENLEGEQMDLFFEQLGVTPSTFKLFAVKDRKSLFRTILQIYKYSGTKESIKTMAKALGATSLIVNPHFVGAWKLMHAAWEIEARYDGLHKYDKGAQHKRQSRYIIVKGIPNADRASYERRFREAWEIFQPAKLFLREILAWEV